MPAKAPLVTREVSTSTVSVDSLASAQALSFSELDSNFLNLRDQTLGLKGSDSTVFDIRAGDTVTFTNATVTSDSTGTFVTTTSLGDLEVNAFGDLTYSTFLSPKGSADRDIVLSGQENGKVSFPNRVVFGSNTENNSRIQITGDNKTIAAYGSNDIGADNELILKSGNDVSEDTSRIRLAAKYLRLNHNVNTFIQATGGNGDFYIQNGVDEDDSTQAGHNSIVLTDTNDGEIKITPKTNKWVEFDGAIKIQDNAISVMRSNDDLVLSSSGTGTLDLAVPTSATIGANGAAAAPTANPVGYIKIKINGTAYQLPYYNI
jgi:hypothetical protein